MDRIHSVLSQDDCTLEDLVACLDHVMRDGNVAVVKFDGERVTEPYTMFISYPAAKGERDMIRVDGGDLKSGLRNLLAKYVEQGR